MIEKTIYLDHQATTPMDPRVLEEMIPYYEDSFGNPHSTDHIIGWKSSQVVDEAASRVAHLIGADSDEIVFTSGATEANNLALLGLARHGHYGQKTKVLIGATEHKCVLAASREMEDRYSLKVQHIPVDREGFIKPDTLSKMLSEDVLLVSVMAVNNEIGTIQDIESLSSVAHKHGALFHCDAAQAPVAKSLTSIASYVDMLSLSAHKMYGPQGIGALYISRVIRERIAPLILGGGQQNGLRSGTIPVPLCVGMGKAADILCNSNAEERRKDLQKKRDRFVDIVEGLPCAISLNGPEGSARHPGNANICFEGVDAHDILASIQPHVAASTGSACTSGTPEPSHVLKSIGLSSEHAESSIRFSLGFTTTDEDVDEAVGWIMKAVQKLSETELSGTV